MEETILLNKMAKKFIFLDFDGVLHGEGQFSNGLFEHIDAFCETVKPFVNNTSIVISSSWRESHSLNELKCIFESEVANIIVGITPQRKDSYNRGGRQKEIQDYCNEFHIAQEDWIALDDMKILFEKVCPNLILTNNETGINSQDLEKLRDFLKN